ncbi:hypothetical protein HOY80DRAFT_32869 [Tuber brumale]|nr:hypothetical protein HOY80DRAFT_32869 [Tuber brumale]
MPFPTLVLQLTFLFFYLFPNLLECFVVRLQVQSILVVGFQPYFEVEESLVQRRWSLDFQISYRVLGNSIAGVGFL